jgi:Transglutaminase-like superfamily
VSSPWALALALVLAGAAAIVAGTTVTGRDQAWVRLPPGLEAAPYSNTGYRLEAFGGDAWVHSTALPMSHDTEFSLPAGRDAGGLEPVPRLARSLTTGATSHGDATLRILAWLSRNLRYELDREAPQDAATVLARRSGYCTGIARLAVAMFHAVGIEAREVPGWVAENGGGYHRWIEVYDPATGWTFSDPLRYHGFVPATYVRLAGESVANAVAESGVLLTRESRLTGIDDESASAPWIRQVVTKPRHGASLRVAVEGADRGEAVLAGGGFRRSRELAAGEALFANLPAGSYLLVVSPDGRRGLTRRLELRGRVRAEMLFPADSVPEERLQAMPDGEEARR